MASTAVSIVPWPVITMTSMDPSSALAAFSSSIPSIPGMRMSVISRSNFDLRSAASASVPEPTTVTL